MRKTLVLSSLFVALLVVGCNDPAKDKPKAVTGEAVAAAAVKGGAAYSFDGSSSKVGFVGAKVTGKHEGGFGTFKGTVTIPDGDAEKGAVTVEIDMASVTSDSEKLTGHLKSADFFDAEKHPKAKFESTSVKKGGEGGATHTITGNLTLRGATKSVTFPAKVQVSGDGVVLDAEFGINRKDFGIVYPGKADDLIKDEVLIKLAIKAKKG